MVRHRSSAHVMHITYWQPQTFFVGSLKINNTCRNKATVLPELILECVSNNNVPTHRKQPL